MRVNFLIKKNKKTISLKKLFFIMGALIPPFLVYIIFNVVPTIDVFRMSFYEWSGIGTDMIFVGFDNYELMFKSSKFLISLKNTFILMISATIITVFFALLSAYCLTKTKMKGKTFFKIILYIPNILSIVVIAAMFTNIFAYEQGLLNGILDFLGLDSLKHMWLSEKETVLWCLLYVMIWQATGYYMVMYMAGMDSISPSLYESADLEGAGAFIKFFKITVPLTWSIIQVTLSIFIISSINLCFLLVNSMTKGAPEGYSDVLLNTMYFEAYTNSNYGYGMAIGSFLYVVTFGLAFIIEKITNREQVQL